MTLLPRTLLWRTVVLIALLLAASQIAALQIFRMYEREPRAKQLAQQVVSVVNLTRAALITSQRERRRDLLLDLSQREGMQIYPADPDEPDAPDEADGDVRALPDQPAIEIFSAEVRRQLGPATRILAEREGIEGLWVSFRIEDDDYWLFMPRVPIQRPLPWHWIGWAGLLLALAIIGAYLIVERINRPLKHLSQAAQRIGRGESPPLLEESGPSEISALSRSFNDMSRGLEALEADRALLLAGISHDLRTPLSRLRLGIELLPDSDPKLKQDMVKDIEAMDSIVGQFIGYVRADAGEATVPDGDLNALVRAEAEARSRADMTIATDLAPLPPLPLKPVAVRRLISNLVENALRYGAPPVTIATRLEDDQAVLRVLDCGPGIPESEMARMLQPFTRLDSARSTEGTGLGLAIVERVARLHGARVVLGNRPEGGFEASVSFPTPVERGG